MQSSTPASRRPRMLLVKSWSNGDYPQVSPAIGLLSLASVLRTDARVEVRLADLRLADRPEAELSRVCAEFRPDVVGISALTHESRGARLAAAVSRSVDPHVRVVLGGPHASALGPEVLEKLPGIEAALIGEGEASIVALVLRLAAGESLEGLPGVAHRVDGRVCFADAAPPVAELDALPLPAYDLVDFDDFARRPRFARTGVGRYMTVMSSRGCPFGCLYCHNIFGRRYRVRSAASFVAELELLHRKWGVRELEVIDDAFNLRRDRVLEICRGIVDAGLDVRLSFPNGMRGDLLDEEQLQWLRRAGTNYIAIAVETAAPRMQELIAKKMDLERVREMARVGRRLGIHMHGLFMLNLPGETLEEMRQTADYIVDSPFLSFNLGIATPFPGTGLAELARQRGVEPLEDPVDGFYGARFETMSEASVDEINRLRRRTHLRFYLDPRRAWGLARSLPPRVLLDLPGIFLRRLRLGS
ncbi:MAG: radical SAM protein [Deltaproteobacteria bacterium]|nr:radical SAM protein [Deltaproteobacteria bacterium]